APIFGVSIGLFEINSVVSLRVKDIWIPLVIGIAVGFFAVGFLKLYRVIRAFFTKTLKKVPHQYRIFLIFVVTFVLGLLSYSFISTGHHLIMELFEGSVALYMLLLILLVRSVLTLSASSNSITGGMFVPILALGALISSILGKGMVSLFGFSHEYYIIILILGITACISSMMKTPLTAIFFAVEALSCYENILYVIVVSAVAFVITEALGVKSINDTVVDTRVEEQNEGKTSIVIDTFVTVQADAFAIGKQIRDIFWPTNLFVLSLQHDPNRGAEVDEHGGKEIREGDILHVRYSTFDEASTEEELLAIVGAQKIELKEVDVI
ncbi:MAG: chloride channel protein, partial [Clostridia bacterium]|nr:chloride channel protein [Clostridia bacterium]